MRALVVILLSMVMSACAYSPIYNGKEPYNGSPFMLLILHAIQWTTSLKA